MNINDKPCLGDRWIKISRKIRLAFASLMSFLLVACGENNEDLRLYMESMKGRSLNKIEALPDLSPDPVFTYSQTNRRDPFKKSDKFAGHSGVMQKRKRHNLELVALDALTFKGILKEGNTLWGLIAESDGKIIKVQSGQYMGKNNGKIVCITHDHIKLEEVVKQQEKWKKQVVILKVDTGTKTDTVNQLSG